jgi:UV DNA damage endonuclease
MRLGFAVKVLGQPNLKTNDSRRWQNHPHLSVSLAYVRDVVVYLGRVGISMYRLSSDLAPYVTHPDMPQFHGQIEECRAELAEIGRLAREADIRLSFHPSQYVVLSAPDEIVARKSMADIDSQAAMLDAMDLDEQAVVVTHVGGVYDDREAAMERFAARWRALSEPGRRRLVLENDDRSYSISDVLRLSGQIGIRCVFDALHFSNHNPTGMLPREALRQCLDTWAAGVTPKVHYSSPRTEMRQMDQRDPATGKVIRVLKPPLWTQHSDFVNPFEFISFLETSHGLRDFDVMLEAKAKDLALLRLRQDLRTMAPELATRVR